MVGFDIDEDAIADFQDNLENFPREAASATSLVLCDVTKLRPSGRKPFDTIITNPPFGTTDRTRGWDLLSTHDAYSFQEWT